MSQPMNPTTQLYLIQCADGHEYEFSAIDDNQAAGLSRKRFPGEPWELYRLVHGERIPVCVGDSECPQPPPPEDLSPPPAYG